ncbi:conserved hypothetical protein [Candidatus Koribacter versatilis Ellin345]|uniref:CBU-0592-like domain-containing protein n=1 Tax=Koribacter versatilis (strain Ellin345) TaxID=204669 RepID=Q1IIT7_KORVE|nr:hypothetical protein [Candidatus Koribacter versatilis]ABF43213.1 conserved hypothetical protein [Candidatus Koribacter versatilis Ellin345]
MHDSHAWQAFSFVGAMMILVAYGGQQMKRMDPRSAAYNLLNIIGSGILCYSAFRPFNLGFVVLEGTWVLISVYAMMRNRRERPAD